LSIPAFATKKRITVLMMVLVTLVLGVMSYTRTPVDLLPNMEFPMAAVVVTFPGAAPQEIEALVTRPLEATLATVSNMREVESTSSEGQAVITISFNWGTNMDFATLEMREKVDLAKRFFPAEVGTPTVLKFDPAMMPIMVTDIGSDKLTSAELRDLADRTLAARIERLPGVASVTVVGGQQSVIEVSVDPARSEALGITLAQITGSLRTASMSMPGGVLNIEGEEVLIRSVGQLVSLTEVENLVVGMRTIRTPAPVAVRLPLPAGVNLPPALMEPQFTTSLEPVLLKQVATVALANPFAQSVMRLNSLPAVSLRMQKESGANTVLVANLVKAELDMMRTDYPDLAIVATQDQSRFIEQAIGSVGTNALYGGIIAVLVLFVFLKSITTTLIIALAVPISVVATFVLIYFGNLTLNLMTLMGLALGIGMLVDNSIVVLENIFRLQEEGVDSLLAARRGAEEVAMAISASTLTTVAVFLPVAFVGGITGLMFRELALTVSFSLIASLAVALLVVPMLAATLLRARPKISTERQARYSPYQRSLRWALQRKPLVMLVTLVLLGGSLLTFPHLGGEFIPPMDQGELRVTVTLPSGSAFAETDRVAREIETELIARGEVLSVATSIGVTGTRGPIMGGSSARRNRATMTVVLHPGQSGADLAAELNEQYATFAGATVVADSVAGMGGGMLGTGSPVQINLSGPSLEGLRLHADEIKNALAEVEGITEVTDNMGVGASEFVIRVKRTEAAELGVSPMAVASAVRTAFQGETVARVSREGREIDVTVRLAEAARQNLSALENLMVAAPQGRIVRLKDVASVEPGVGPAAVRRLNNQRVVSISASIAERDLQSVSRDVEQKLQTLSLPDDYSYEVAGEMSEMREAFDGLTLALVLAIVLVYMVMAAQFESLLYPLIVMFSLPLAIIGVLLGLFFTGTTLSVPSVMGIIVLAGIVVNNAIVLVDFINQLRERGKGVEEAIVEAAGVRLRPILMTTATTVLALVPLAVMPGSGAEMQQPLGIAVIGGLTVSTILTLYIIPIAYDLVTLRRRNGHEPEEA